MAASQITLSRPQLERLNQKFVPQNISGPRYPAATQPEIDTEEFWTGLIEQGNQQYERVARVIN